MRVVSVEMRDFRSYTRAEAHLGAGLTVVHGPNGTGKSNLLEALYFGCTARSPRTRNERELVRFGATATRVAVRLLDGAQTHELTVGYGAAAGGQRAEKRMTADGAPVERLLDVPDRPLLSVFQPDRLELVKGPPSLRRAHLDQVVAAIWPARADVAPRVLAGARTAQRPARAHPLQARRRRRRSRPGIASSRAGPLDARRDTAQRRSRCSPGRLPSTRPSSAAAARRPSSTARARARVRSRSSSPSCNSDCASDLERGFSGHGPHRDELAILRDGRELRVYGSQGEQRLALLALLLAERDVLARERRRPPLMLLDDVMSELDCRAPRAARRRAHKREDRASSQRPTSPTCRAPTRHPSHGCASLLGRSCRRRIAA